MCTLVTSAVLPSVLISSPNCRQLLVKLKISELQNIFSGHPYKALSFKASAFARPN